MTLIKPKDMPDVVWASVFPADSLQFNAPSRKGGSIHQYFRGQLFASLDAANAWIGKFSRIRQWKNPEIITVPGYCQGCCEDGEWFHILEPRELVGFMRFGDDPWVLFCAGALWNLNETEAHYQMPYIEPHSHFVRWDGQRERFGLCTGAECDRYHELRQVHKAKADQEHKAWEEKFLRTEADLPF